MNNFFDNQRILEIIWNRKFHFAVIGFIAILLSAVFSGPAFIKPKYKSTARVYPTSNIATFSNESESEQVLEIINSRDIKLKMFDAFDLYSVYKIKREDPQHLTYMMDKYNTNVSASKTEYETIELKVLDVDPVRACNMCDSIISFFNQKIKSMHGQKYLEVAEITDRFVKAREKELDSLENNLKILREKSGIVNFDSYSSAVSSGYMRALSNNTGTSRDASTIKQQLESLKENGTEAYKLERSFYKMANLIDSLKMVKTIALSEANKNITYCHVVEKPIPADKKSYPVRWLIVGFSTISVIFLALLVFLILDYRKKD